MGKFYHCTPQVKFSTNEGQCWFEQSFVSEEDGFVPFGVISVPESTNARVRYELH